MDGKKFKSYKPQTGENFSAGYDGMLQWELIPRPIAENAGLTGGNSNKCDIATHT
jgi:hypothetical protein